MKKIIILSLLLFGGFTLFTAPASAKIRMVDGVLNASANHSVISNSGRDNGFDSIHTKVYTYGYNPHQAGDMKEYTYGYDPAQAGDMKAILSPYIGMFIFSKMKSENFPITPTDLANLIKNKLGRKTLKPIDLRNFFEGHVERKSGSIILLGGNNQNDIIHPDFLMVLVAFSGIGVSAK